MTSRKSQTKARKASVRQQSRAPASLPPYLKRPTAAVLGAMLLNAEETRRHVLALLDDDRDARPVPTIRTKQITDRDGTILREATAEPASWRDPADTSPNRRNPKQIEGYRAADALVTLKKRGGQITQLHMRAANRLRSSHELGELGIRPGYERPEVGSAHFGPTDGPNVMRLDALQSYREAKAAVPRSQWPILEHVVIKNGSVSSYGAEHRMRRDQAVGYLIAALDCLVDHYGLRNKKQKRKAP
jgi:hypothetical protein